VANTVMRLFTKTSRAALAVGLAVVLASDEAGGSTIYVDGGNTRGPWDGSVEHPHQHIQTGIDAATDGDEVVVRAGRYAGAGNRDLDFSHGLGAGRTRAITVRSETGPEATVIDCEAAGLGFSFASGEENDSVLDGFTIANGNRGGISIRGSSPTIRNCVIAANEHRGVSGGGLVISTHGITDGDGPVITGCTIVGNSAAAGAGIYCSGRENVVHPVLTVTRCIISGNRATLAGAEGFGGGIYCMNNGSYERSGFTVSHCLIVGNWASSGGGICVDEDNPRIVRCTIAGNHPEGLRIWDGLHMEVHHSILWDGAHVTEAYSHSACDNGNVLFPSKLTVSHSNVRNVLVASDGALYWGEGNTRTRPPFGSGPGGTWTRDGSYADFRIVLTDEKASWQKGELVGRFVEPDVTEYLQFPIIANTATTITIWADHGPAAGRSWIHEVDEYRIRDYRLGTDWPGVGAPW